MDDTQDLTKELEEEDAEDLAIINTPLTSLLLLYAGEKDSVFINFKEFCEYVRDYARKNVTQKPELSNYLDINDAMLLSELERLDSVNVVHLIKNDLKKISVAVLQYYSFIYKKRYEDILTNPSLPYPAVQDLPKRVPEDCFKKVDYKKFITALLNGKEELTSHKVVAIALPNSTPSLLFPLCVPVMTLIKGAVYKVIEMLKKEEYYEFFLKKLRNVNPNKDLTVKNFYSRTMNIGENVEDIFVDDSDSFYFWNQLSYAIRQDFEKVQERSSFDSNILQALSCADVWVLFLKEKRLLAQRKEAAAKDLEQSFLHAPFYFTMEDIIRFKDSRGVYIYNTLGPEGLKAQLDALTTQSADNSLPKILTLRLEDGTQYYIHKTQVLPLILKLSNESHKSIKEAIKDKWYKSLLKHKRLTEMKDQKAFNLLLERCVKKHSPLLYALLNASYLPVLNAEIKKDISNKQNKFNIFMGSKMQSYADMLLLNSQSILQEAKDLLPFWYTIPILSWIFSLLFLDDKEKKSAKKSENPAAMQLRKERTEPSGQKMSKVAESLVKELLPGGISLEDAIEDNIDNWNRIIGREAHNNLTMDVNALIKDYTRKVTRTLSAKTLTLERIDNLAATLAKTPNMEKINGGDALFTYIKLYMLYLIIKGRQ